MQKRKNYFQWNKEGHNQHNLKMFDKHKIPSQRQIPNTVNQRNLVNIIRNQLREIEIKKVLQTCKIL